jgi:hypothetical protein
MNFTLPILASWSAMSQNFGATDGWTWRCLHATVHFTTRSLPTTWALQRTPPQETTPTSFLGSNTDFQATPVASWLSLPYSLHEEASGFNKIEPEITKWKDASNAHYFIITVFLSIKLEFRLLGLHFDTWFI